MIFDVAGKVVAGPSAKCRTNFMSKGDWKSWERRRRPSMNWGSSWGMFDGSIDIPNNQICLLGNQKKDHRSPLESWTLDEAVAAEEAAMGIDESNVDWKRWFSLRYIDDVLNYVHVFQISLVTNNYDCGWECPFANCFDVNARISRFWSFLIHSRYSYIAGTASTSVLGRAWCSSHPLSMTMVSID